MSEQKPGLSGRRVWQIIIGSCVALSMGIILMASIVHNPTGRSGQAFSITITNSGSTNLPGSTLTINQDGSGKLTYEQDQRNNQQRQPQSFAPQTFAVSQLATLLARLKDVSLIPDHGCLKSISFGSTTKLSYQGHTSGDLSCIAGSDAELHRAVAQETMRLYRQATKTNL